MANLLLPLLAGTLPEGTCPATLQEILNLFADNLQAVLANGRSFYNYGPDKPAPEYQAYPWLRTTDGRWYQFSGVWRAPNNYSASERRWWIGDEPSLVNYDGGSPGSVTPTTGPMWVVDHDFDGRSPMGPGVIVNDPATTTLAVATNYGSGGHTLTEAEGAVGAHTHAFGLTNPGNDDAFFNRPGTSPVTAYMGYYVTGSNGNVVASQSNADLFTSPANLGAGVTSAAFSITHPVRGLFCIKPSGRVYYTVL